MYPVSSTVAALFEAEQKQVLRITGTAPGRYGNLRIYSGSSLIFEQGIGQTASVYSGTAQIYDSTSHDTIHIYSGDRVVFGYDRDGIVEDLTITDADVMVGGFTVDRFSCAGEKLSVGSAIAGELTLKLNNTDGKFDNIVFEGTELFVEVGIADWSQTNPTITYIPIGYFTPDEQPRRKTTISLKALDRMTRFDKLQPTLVNWTDGNGNIIQDGNGNDIAFNTYLRFPSTVQELIEAIADRCDVPFTQDISSFPNYNYTLTKMPELQTETTYRTMLQWCAGIMGTCAYIDWTGSLKFGWYDEADYTCTPANRYESDLFENDITITGIAYKNTQDITLVSGTGDYALDLTGNYLAGTGIATILPNINTALNGFTYRPFSATVINAPYLWPLDIITFTDKDGEDHNCIITNVNFGLNGITALEGRGEPEQINKAAPLSGLTTEQAFMIEKAAEYTRQLDDSLDQEAIFNRLTDNGTVQGLILYNGQIYLNASYIQTGTLIADLIKGGVLKLGGSNNDNGVFMLVDADGNTVGEFTNDGIFLKLPGSTAGLYISTDGKLTIGAKPVNSGDTFDDNAAFQVLSNGLVKAREIILVDHTDYQPSGGISGDTIDGILVLDSTSTVVAQIASNRTIFNQEVDANSLHAGDGATGTFTAGNKTITVTDGIITSIV